MVMYINTKIPSEDRNIHVYDPEKNEFEKIDGLHILPLADRKGFEADRPGIPASMTVIVKGSYAGISPLPDYAASKKTPEFAARVLDSPIALRLRPHLVAPILRLLTEAMAGQAKAKNCRGTVPADSSEARCAWLHAAHLAARGVCDGMDALQTVDLGLDSEDGQASVQFVLTPVPGRRGILPSGAQARAATDLARCLPQEYPAVTIWALDFPRLAEIIGPLATATQRVQAQRALFPGHALAAAMQHAGLELLRANRGAIVQAAGPGAEGFTWIAIHGVSDAERLARRHREELLPGLAGRPGFDLTIEPESTLGGVPVYAYRLRLDPDALGGKSGADSAAAARAAALAREAMTQLGTSGELVGRVAGVHDKLFLVGQRDPALLGELLARAQQPSPPVPSWLRAVLASPPDTLCWYARTDVQALLAPLSRLGGLEGLDGELARTLAALAQSPPAPVTLRGTVRRGIYRGELRADVAQLRDLVGGFIKAAAAHTDARGHGSPMEHQP
jgi:hypothetical protein